MRTQKLNILIIFDYIKEFLKIEEDETKSK